METRADLASKLRRYAFLDHVRPASLAAPLMRAAFPSRHVIDHDGLRLSISPASHLGRSLLLEGAYEPQTFAQFRAHIRPGDTVLDIGANEGVFSALAGALVGPGGYVVSVEPQSRLLPIIEANLKLNTSCQTRIVHAAVTERDGESVQISLFPENNTGASGLVRKYRWGAKTETVQTVTPAALLSQIGRKRFDFVKVDVEGFEPEVARALPLDRVGVLLLDYHSTILADRGIDPAETDALIQRTHRAMSGSFEAGYVLYTPR